MTPTDLQSTLRRLGIRSQASAARLLGVDRSAVHRWVQGHRSVPGPIIHLLAACEEVPGMLDWLREQPPVPRNVCDL